MSQTDYDGITEVFKPAAIDFGKGNPSIIKAKVFSNPFVDNFSVQFYTDENIHAQVMLLSLHGHLVFKENIEIKDGKNEYHFTAGDKLKPGAYILKIQTESKMILSEKVVKN